MKKVSENRGIMIDLYWPIQVNRMQPGLHTICIHIIGGYNDTIKTINIRNIIFLKNKIISRSKKWGGYYILYTLTFNCWGACPPSFYKDHI